MIANLFAGAVRTAALAVALAVLPVSAHAQQPSANAVAMAHEILTMKGSAALYETLSWRGDRPGTGDQSADQSDAATAAR